MNADITLTDRFQGVIIGAAVGDALGMPTEYISTEQLDALYNGRVTQFETPNPQHPCSHLKAGQYTDDTQQLVLLAQSLQERGEFDIADFGRRMGHWAHQCRTVPGYDRFSGGTSIGAGIRLHDGEDPYTTGIPRPTCGSAMRIPPIGAFYHNKIEDLAEAATLASTVTHNHPAAVDSALLISHIVAYLTNGEGVDQAVQKASKLLSSDLRKNIEYVLNHQYSPPQQVASIIGASESSYETVPMAVHCLIHSPEDFEQTVIEAANLTPGDTDSIACIAGAMSGAHNGIQAIPSRFMAVEDVTYLIALADALLESSR